MPHFGPIKRKDLIKYLHQIGFEGPFSGGKHEFMVKDDTTIYIPNPHKGDIGKAFLLKILRQAHISKEEWEKMK